MFDIAKVTLKGIFRDRVFHGIIVICLLFLLIPSISSLSMRQVTELSITLAFSLLSFILLLLAVFLGGTSVWKDIERRYTFSVISLPLSRPSYLIGKFAGVAFFMVLTALLLGGVAMLVVKVVSGMYPPDRPVVWWYLMATIGFDTLKYVLLIAIAFLFSAISTSFFLPIFGTICIFLVGSATQQVYDYLHSTASSDISPVVKKTALILYYLLPNFSAFDLKANAIYSIPLNSRGLLITVCYGVTYSIIVLLGASLLFSRREMK